MTSRAHMFHVKQCPPALCKDHAGTFGPLSQELGEGWGSEHRAGTAWPQRAQPTDKVWHSDAPGRRTI